MGQLLQSFHLGVFPLNLLRHVDVSLYWGVQTGHSMCECEMEADKNFLCSPSDAPADAASDVFPARA